MPNLGSCPSCHERFSFMSVLKRQRCSDCKATYCSKCGSDQLNVHRCMSAGSTHSVKCCTLCTLYRAGPATTNRTYLQSLAVRDLKEYLKFLEIPTEHCIAKTDLVDLITSAPDVKKGCRPKQANGGTERPSSQASSTSSHASSSRSQSTAKPPEAYTRAEASSTRTQRSSSQTTQQQSSTRTQPSSTGARPSTTRATPSTRTAAGYTSNWSSTSAGDGSTAHRPPAAAAETGPSRSSGNSGSRRRQPSNRTSADATEQRSTSQRSSPPGEGRRRSGVDDSPPLPAWGEATRRESDTSRSGTHSTPSLSTTSSSTSSLRGGGHHRAGYADVHSSANAPPQPPGFSGTAAADSRASRGGGVVFTPPPEPRDKSMRNQRGYRVDLCTIHADDIALLTVMQLKETLAVNFVDFRGCVEKRELVELVMRLWLEKHPLPGQATDDSETGTFMKSSSPVDGSDSECRICMDESINCVLLECGHMCCCVKCGRQLAECPICRRYVSRVVHVFKT
ncbi:E3 ubiquitin-protein ligase RNF34-like [Sycon ciliatum]|uniref:E3 ubiquitin-protein ligase RNF34-like n=1 Tax=Sycon ciliatum TaxID=27933 RepID=UPI0031F63770